MHFQAIKKFALALMVASPLICFTGCGSKNSSRPANRRIHGESRDYLELAQQSLERLDEFDVEVLSKSVVNDLNRWIEAEGEIENWMPDELLRLLPQSYRDASVPAHGRLDEATFGYHDFYHIRQAIWSRSIAHWVAGRTTSEGFEWLIKRVTASASDDQKTRIDRDGDKLFAALQVAHQDLSESDVAKLASAVRLFDWTIRNVQLLRLEEFVPVNTVSETIKLPDGTERHEKRWSFPAESGIAGPGYTLDVWEALLYGQGDAWQRARVFIQLARQLDITAVMLAFDEPEPTNWRPWLPAVFLGGQLYLMDSDLGIVLPSFQGPGIATLQELVGAPHSIRALDVSKPENQIPESLQSENESAKPADPETVFRYPVDKEDLTRVVVLVDASFPSLSKRMLQLERNLVGKNRLILSVQPAEMSGPLLACKGVKDVRIWTVPFDVRMYAQAKEELAARNVSIRLRQVLLDRMYGELNDFLLARHNHFLGQLRADQKSRQPGAIDYYQKANLRQEQIRKLVTNNQQALEAMAKLTRVESNEDAETPAFSTSEDRSATTLPEAKWLAIDGLKKTLKENDIDVTEMELQQIFGNQLSQTSLHARYWMSLALFELRSFPDSADWLRRIRSEFQTDRWTTGIHYNLARAYEAMGDIRRARQLYEEDTSPQQFGSLLRSRLLEGDAEPSGEKKEEQP